MFSYLNIKEVRGIPKNMDFWSPKKMILSFVANNKALYFFGVISMLTTATMQVSLPQIIGKSVDVLKNDTISIFGYGQKNSFLVLVISYVVVNLLLTIGRFGWRVTLARLTHLSNRWLRGIVWDKARFFYRSRLDEKFTVGVLMNASTSDAKTSSYLFGFTLVAAFDVVFLGAFTVISMLLISIPMTFGVLSITFFLPLVVSRLARAEGVRHSWAQALLSKFNDEASRAIATIRLQRLTSTGNFWERKLTDSAEAYRVKRFRAVLTSLRFFPVFGIVVTISYAVLFVMGIYFVQTDSLTIGEFVAMQGLIFLMQDPLIELGFVISDIQKAVTSLQRLADVYNEKQDSSLIENKEQLVDKDTTYTYEVSGLTHSYGGGINTLDNFSFNLKKGERLGIVGPIGSGKTTLTNILSGLTQNYSGTVKLHGKDIKSYGHEFLRNHISVVSQKSFLFSDTVKNNVVLGNGNYSDVQVWYFLELAGLKDEVQAFTDGLNTMLGEWGINLSGGQKQRLTLARALATNPKLLIMDDCLSAVDTVTERKILDNLNKFLEGRTVIWVAHRRSTLRYCDNIVEMQR